LGNYAYLSPENAEAASTSVNEWVYEELIETKAAQKARGGKTYIPTDWIHSSATDKNGAAFVCNGKKLSLIVAMKPQNISTLFNGQKKGRAMNRSLSLFINNELVDKSTWILRPGKDLASAKNQKVIRKIYNAAIRGDTVSVQRKSSAPKIEISLPKVNDAFADFGGPCGIGRKK